MVLKSDYISKETVNGVTVRMYKEILSFRDNTIDIDEKYTGYQSVISFPDMEDKRYPHIFVSSPEESLVDDLKTILNKTSPIWADSSDEITCQICRQSKDHTKVHAVTFFQFTDSPSINLLQDQMEKHTCEDCIQKAENALLTHINNKEYQEKFIASKI